MKGENVLKPGRNIGIKVPSYRWRDTVVFYRDRVGLKERSRTDGSVAFAFGTMTLWVDKTERQSQTDVWLELVSDDPGKALTQLGSPKRDELEPLQNVRGHWTSDPAGVVLLLSNGVFDTDQGIETVET